MKAIKFIITNRKKIWSPQYMQKKYSTQSNIHPNNSQQTERNIFNAIKGIYKNLTDNILMVKD